MIYPDGIAALHQVEGDTDTLENLRARGSKPNTNDNTIFEATKQLGFTARVAT